MQDMVQFLRDKTEHGTTSSEAYAIAHNFGGSRFPRHTKVIRTQPSQPLSSKIVGLSVFGHILSHPEASRIPMD